jgi:hypothetical protein
MKEKLFGVFSNIDDAKSALGQIKMESWNRADLTVLFSGQKIDKERREDDFELAAEYFLNDSQRTPPPIWPGFREENIHGIGKVQIGSSYPVEKESLPGKIEELAGGELETIGREISSQKVVTIIEVEPEIMPKVRFILEKNGAEVFKETPG